MDDINLPRVVRRVLCKEIIEAIKEASGDHPEAFSVLSSVFQDSLAVFSALKALSTTALSGALVNELTTGTIMSDTSIANAPALMGERIFSFQPRSATDFLRLSKALMLRLKRTI